MTPHRTCIGFACFMLSLCAFSAGAQPSEEKGRSDSEKRVITPMRHLKEAELQIPHLPRRGEPLVLDELLESVGKYHPLISAVEQERKLAEADLLSAEGAFDPSLKGDNSTYGTGYYTGNRQNLFVDLPVRELNGGRVTAGYRRSGGLFPVYEDEYYTNDGGEFRAAVEIPLLRDGATDRRRATISRAVLQQVAAEANIGVRRIELIRAAANTYWDWVAAGNRFEIFQDLLKVAELRQEQLQERVKRGDLPEFDLVDNQRSLLQRKSLVVSAERALLNTSFELSLFYRDSQGKQLRVERERLPSLLPDPTPGDIRNEEELIERALASRPELQRIDAQRKQNAVELDLAENQRLPRLDLNAMASQDTGDGSSTREEGEIKAGVKFEIPIMNRVADGRVGFSKAKESELANLQNFARERIATDVKDSLVALRLAEQRIAIAKDEFRAARELEVGERDRFELGDSNLIFVNIREQTAAEAAARVVDFLLDYHKARASFRAALGQDAR